MIGIVAYEHVGIRVTDRTRSLRFYRELGFEPVDTELAQRAVAVDLINLAGVRVNLICNGIVPPGGHNVLMDITAKWPGITHPAFTVGNLDDVLQWAQSRGVTITEGPVIWENRRRVCFVRDPDGNVLEFDELLTVGNQD